MGSTQNITILNKLSLFYHFLAIFEEVILSKTYMFTPNLYPLASTLKILHELTLINYMPKLVISVFVIFRENRVLYLVCIIKNFHKVKAESI